MLRKEAFHTWNTLVPTQCLDQNAKPESDLAEIPELELIDVETTIAEARARLVSMSNMGFTFVDEASFQQLYLDDNRARQQAAINAWYRTLTGSAQESSGFQHLFQNYGLKIANCVDLSEVEGALYADLSDTDLSTLRVGPSSEARSVSHNTYRLKGARIRDLILESVRVAFLEAEAAIIDRAQLININASRLNMAGAEIMENFVLSGAVGELDMHDLAVSTRLLTPEDTESPEREFEAGMLLSDFSFGFLDLNRADIHGDLSFVNVIGKSAYMEEARVYGDLNYANARFDRISIGALNVQGEVKGKPRILNWPNRFMYYIDRWTRKPFNT